MQSRYLILLYCALAVASLVVHSGALTANFVSDDWHWLFVAHEHGRIIPDLLANSIGERHGGSYNPLTSLWLNAEYFLFGLHAVPYHVVSALLHAANALLVAILAFRLLRLRTVPERSARFVTYSAVGAGFLFLVWPTHVEAVNWVASLPHLLSTFFVLGSLAAYTAWRSGKAGYLPISIVAAAAALASKESAIVVLPLMVCLEAWRQFALDRKFSLKRFAPAGAVMVLIAGFFALRWYATGLLFGTYAAESVMVRPSQAVNTVLTFLVDMLTLGTGRVSWMQSYWDQPGVVGLAGCAILVTAVAVLYRRRRADIATALSLCLLSTIPFVPLGFNRLSVEAERYTYLASAFFAIVISALVLRIPGRMVRPVILLMIVAGALVVVNKNDSWWRAGQISTAVLDEVQSFDLADPTQLYFFVGLPDTIDGAQVSRNNIREAILLTVPGVQSELSLIPVYTMLRSGEEDGSLLTWDSDERGFIARSVDGRSIVTGIDRQETDYVTYELWNYDYTFFRSDTIRLIFSESVLERFQARTAHLLTWDAGHLMEIPFARIDGEL